MSLPPQKMREMVFQALYCSTFPLYRSTSPEPNAKDTSPPPCDEWAQEATSVLMRENKVSRRHAANAILRAEAVASHLAEIDTLLRSHLSDKRPWEHLFFAERTCLRLGCYELLFDETIPTRVALSEAIRLARKFASPDAAGLINAVLDLVSRVAQQAPSTSADSPTFAEHAI